MKKILQFLLNTLAKAYILRFKPQIIAVTGNVGKTSAKEAIAAVLRESKRIRISGGNLNNELGVPLTILGDWSDKYYNQGGILFWAKVLLAGIWGLFFYFRYPDILVLEYGADKPRDIEKLVNKFKPHIGVVTAIGEIPVHVEYFSGPRELAKEKSKLIETFSTKDFAILNFDDSAVLNMRDKTKAKILTFGFNEGADVIISNFDFRLSPQGKPVGVSFKLGHKESFVPVRLKGLLGKSQSLASAAAMAVGLAFNMNLVDISNALSLYNGSPGRLKIIDGIKNSTIIDDTYNSSPSAMRLAIDTLKALPSKRKIAVLGDMLELGKYTIIAHQTAGNLVGDFVDLLVCVGARAKFIADAAENQMPPNTIFIFDTYDEARIKVQELIAEGDLILIKGSQSMRMEKIVEEIMAEPEKKSELLVRQGKKWLSK